MKLWAMLCRVTQDGWVMVESYDKTWSTEEGNGKPLQYSCLQNPTNSMKRQKDRTLKDELPRLVDAQYATGEEWRNNSRKNEETESKWKQSPILDMTSDGSEVQCSKEQCCIGTWNVRSMNQCKLEVAKHAKVAKVNIDILEISEPKWTGMDKFNSDDHYIYHCGQESLRRNRVSLMVNKRVQNAHTWVQSQKQQNDLLSFPRQKIQYYSNSGLCPKQQCRRSWR